MILPPNFLAAKPVFDALGYSETRFVGGCVRDFLAGIEASDIDIATTIQPDDAMRILSIHHNINTVPTGIKYGTITAVINKQKFEITTLRQDIKTFGRDATVEFGHNWQADALRRDFTINSMSMNFDGELFDYFSGKDDLQNGIVRFVGNASERIREDYLRILRFFRFNMRFAKHHPSLDILRAISAHKNEISQLSAERVQWEMLKIISHSKHISALRLMEECGITDIIFPVPINISALENIHNNIQISLAGRIAALIGINPDNAYKLAVAWKLSNKMVSEIIAICNADAYTRTDLNGRQVLQRVCMNYSLQTAIDFACINHARYTFSASDISEIENWIPPVFPITGDTLLQRGFKEGKELGEALNRLYAIWENSDYTLSAEDLISQ